MKPRVRIAPSPTGFLHVGTARTALYNYLFARNQGGTFILRIEDTDVERSTPEMTELIIESLKWLGLNWDEEPYFQSKRFPIYKKYAEQFQEKKLCYPCYCTKEEIEARKQRVLAQKKAWKYDRHCYNLTEDEKKKLEGQSGALRFFVPEGKVSFNDGLRGVLERDSQDIEDFVILKSDGSPTYNFACAIDDHEMGITHVMRGEDHIANTFKQVLLYKALGWESPEFIHLPLILGSDRSKLSKRHGAVSVLDYRKQGILPEAFVNFLALLGWSPGGDKEFMSKSELVELFSLDRLSKTAAVFDTQKLEWMNGKYINRLSDEEVLEKILAFLTRPAFAKASAGREGTELTTDKNYTLKVVGILKERMRKLTDFLPLGSYFFNDPQEYDKEGVEKHFKDPDALKKLELLKDKLSAVETFDLEGIEKVIRGLAAELDIKAAQLIHPLRLALSGKTVGPSLFHMVEILGQERVVERIEKTINYIKMNHRGHREKNQN